MEVGGKVECAVAAKRMWKAAFEDGHTCMPKAVTHAISHVSYDGPGFSQGSLRTIHLHRSYAEHLSQEQHPQHVVYHVKEQLEKVDPQNFKMKGKFLEGGFLNILVKKYTQSVHIEGTSPNTCIVHWYVEYEALSEEHQAHILTVFQELVPLGYKAIESYLLSHDDYKE
ncbi:hypothetical protein GOP47_0004649 [Adiantum capillus-veneris]|uniref:Bet v I/Major latex protein domain-containing protein n=1 Tax=Adiantum capillus-veneris TaxID=13818 RepID=A0A9D4V7U5_ADICA|nr:hypothetical protein GOP47_0004206 [Adiantum capillus-veneris]KAI5081466.1 hypothetical protein GOP47_0004649 [Adiantum capillus-veneris]